MWVFDRNVENKRSVMGNYNNIKHSADYKMLVARNLFLSIIHVYQCSFENIIFGYTGLYEDLSDKWNVMSIIGLFRVSMEFWRN